MFLGVQIGWVTSKALPRSSTGMTKNQKSDFNELPSQSRDLGTTTISDSYAPVGLALNTDRTTPARGW
jgi:hypothetical protein